MFVAVIIIHVICSLALILIVLLQAGKGVGIANVFGGAGQTVFGARTGDVLARGTEICAGLFMLTSLGLAMLSSDRSGSVMRKVRPMPVQEQQIPLQVPVNPAQQDAMAKIKETLATMAEGMKKAAATDPSQKPVVQQQAAPTETAAPVAPSPAAEQPAVIAEPAAQPAAETATQETPAAPVAPAEAQPAA